jgi:hypothetical protein
MRIHRRNFLQVVGVAEAAASLRGPALAEESIVTAPQGDGLDAGSTSTLTSASGQTIKNHIGSAPEPLRKLLHYGIFVH